MAASTFVWFDFDYFLGRINSFLSSDLKSVVICAFVQFHQCEFLYCLFRSGVAEPKAEAR